MEKKEKALEKMTANHLSLNIEKNVGLAEEEVPVSAKIVIYRVMQEAVKLQDNAHLRLS